MKTERMSYVRIRGPHGRKTRRTSYEGANAPKKRTPWRFIRMKQCMDSEDLHRRLRKIVGQV